jgi:hypothetical protein
MLGRKSLKKVSGLGEGELRGELGAKYTARSFISALHLPCDILKLKKIWTSGIYEGDGIIGMRNSGIIVGLRCKWEDNFKINLKKYDSEKLSCNRPGRPLGL